MVVVYIKLLALSLQSQALRFNTTKQLYNNNQAASPATVASRCDVTGGREVS